MKKTSHVVFMALVLSVLVSLPLAAETVQWLPAAASNSGLHGTVWTTDLWITNRVSDRPITVYLAFLAEEDGVVDPVEIPVEIPVINRAYIQDVVGSLFGESRPGAIRLRSEHQFEVRSQTFNSGSEVGIFGQGIPAVDSSTTVPVVTLVGASNGGTENQTRTNIGLLNPNNNEIHVFVFVYGETYQEYLGRADFRLGPLGWRQENLFDLIGRTIDVQDAIVSVFSTNIDEPVISYLSVVDEASGDGTYLEAVNGMPAYTEPLDWIIDLTVTVTDGIADQLTVTVDDGDPEIFTDLSAGAQVTLESHVGMFELCFAVDVAADPGQSARVSVDVDANSSRGDYGGGSAGTGGTGNYTFDNCYLIGPGARIDP